MLRIVALPLLVPLTSVVYSVSDTGTGPEQRNETVELVAKQRGMLLVKLSSVRPRMQSGAIEQNSDGMTPPS